MVSHLEHLEQHRGALEQMQALFESIMVALPDDGRARRLAEVGATMAAAGAEDAQIAADVLHP